MNGKCVQKKKVEYHGTILYIELLIFNIGWLISLISDVIIKFHWRSIFPKWRRHYAIEKNFPFAFESDGVGMKAVRDYHFEFASTHPPGKRTVIISKSVSPSGKRENWDIGDDVQISQTNQRFLFIISNQFFGRISI